MTNTAWNNAPHLKAVVEQTIILPRIEAQLRNEIPTLGASTDKTSHKVQSMYEESPYPRWLTLEKIPHWTLRELIRADLPSLPEAALPAANDAPRVLIAGCGTGRQALWASHYTRGNVLAVDLSKSSLAYALRKSREYDIFSIDYLQADILNLAQLNRSFDVIECMGVLHHMQDPMAGWRILTGLLAPGGVMKIALYSTRGRQAIASARAWITEKGYTPTLDSIRTCRQEILISTYDWAETVKSYADFYSMSECRDLLFHVMEHTYTLPQIEKTLNTLGLKFLGLKPPHGQHYLQIYEHMFPQDMEKNSLAHWGALEEKFPHAFASMYEFWVKKA